MRSIDRQRRGKHDYKGLYGILIILSCKMSCISKKTELTGFIRSSSLNCLYWGLFLASSVGHNALSVGKYPNSSCKKTCTRDDPYTWKISKIRIFSNFNQNECQKLMTYNIKLCDTFCTFHTIARRPGPSGIPCDASLRTSPKLIIFLDNYII